MNWNTLVTILQNLYTANGYQTNFISDELYLRRAFYGIEYYWLTQYINLKDIRYVMISEAPLWGNNDAYFYNPNYTGNASFFNNGDLKHVLKLKTTTRHQLLYELNKIGFIVLDIFPFAFNSQTQFQYNKDYTQLKKRYATFIDDVFDNFLMHKLDLIASKRGKSIKLFYRYNKVSRVKPDIESRLLQKGLIIANQVGFLPSVHKGYPLDRTKLSMIIP